MCADWSAPLLFAYGIKSFVMINLIWNYCKTLLYLSYIFNIVDFQKGNMSKDAERMADSEDPDQTIRIFNGCEVRIENSITKVTVWNSYLSDGIFNSHRRTIMDSFSCLHFHRKLYLNFHMRYYINITLNCLHFRSRHDRFGFYLWRWRRNIWRKMTSKSDVMMSKLMCDVKKTPWRHARDSSYSPCVRQHFIARSGSRKFRSGMQECFFRSSQIWVYTTWFNLSFLNLKIYAKHYSPCNIL